MHRQGMNEFHQWLEEQIAKSDDGIFCSKVEIALIDECTGYGLFAKEDIRSNETIIKIPEKFLIIAPFIVNIPEYANIIEGFSLEPSEILALFFAFERFYFESEQNGGNQTNPKGFAEFMKIRENRTGNVSDDGSMFWWKYYMGVLPRQFGTPLFKYYLEKNGDEKIKKITAQLPQQVKDKLLQQLIEMKLFEQKLFQVLIGRNENKCEDVLPEDFAALNLKESEGEYGLNMRTETACIWRKIACWAWHIVNTRSIFMDHLACHPLLDVQQKGVENGNEKPNCPAKKQKKNRAKESDYGEGCLALVPLVDMLNHRHDAQCIPMFDKKSHSYVVRVENHFVLAGQQLFVCYGPHDNANLWIEYGFVTDENPFNRVNIPIELFIALSERCGTRVSSTKKEILTKADLPCTIYATDDVPSYALHKNCSILLMPKDKLTRWSQYIFGPRDAETEEMDNMEESYLLKAILTRLQAALIAKADECSDEEIRSFWRDQIVILKQMLLNMQP